MSAVCRICGFRAFQRIEPYGYQVVVVLPEYHRTSFKINDIQTFRHSYIQQFRHSGVQKLRQTYFICSQVVLDISTKTCGPCKMIYPKVLKLSEEYPAAVFLKINGDHSDGTRVRALSPSGQFHSFVFKE